MGYACSTSANATITPCPAGYACPGGAKNATAVTCGVNQFSGVGASACSNCPVGQGGSAGSSSCVSLCPNGWRYYYDSSGVEGQDSCVWLASTGVLWTSAATVCRCVTVVPEICAVDISDPVTCATVLGSAAASGAHMLTSAQPNKTAPGLYSFVVAMWGTSLFAVGASWPGDTNSADKGWGQWAWVDGTNASNLNCYSGGCGLWSR